MVNFKNLLAGFVGTFVVVSALSVALPASAQLNDPEFTTAFNGILTTDGYTNATTEENFRPYDLITRGEFAKPASKLAAEELCLERDMTMACSFSDTAGYDYSLVPFITAACQMELVKGSNGMYYPNNAITKAEVLTVYSRALAAANGEAAPSEDVTPRWANHHRAMLAAGITNETDVNGLDRAITRYEAYLMVARLANATTLVCEGELDLSDLLADLFGDEDEEVIVDEEDEDDTTTTTTVSDGMVMAMLSPSTANGDTVPGLATIEVAAFDFTADGDDVELETIVLERFGLGNDDVIDDVTLLVNGAVVSKSRGFNNDDEVTLTLNPEVLIEAGETVTVTVLAEIGDAEGTDNVSNQEFSIGLTDFQTNGDEDTSNLPLRGNSFRVAGVNAAEVIVSADGSLSDVELGEQGAEIAAFTLENDSDDMVMIQVITLEDDENEIEDSFENFVLMHNNREVAMVANVDDKYLTFVLTTPVEIDENEEEDFKVLADVIGGAGEQVNLIIDEKIYVRGIDERYGYGLAVDVTAPNGYRPTPQDINAGEITFVELDLSPDELRSDRENFVIAAFDVNVNEGQDLSLEDIKFTISASNNASSGAVPFNATTTLLSQFDEVELIVSIDGTRRTYDLDTTNAGNIAFTAEDDDLGIFLPEGSNVIIYLEVDTKNQFDTNVVGNDLRVTLNVANDVEIIENDDDEEVTDIVPSSITFDTIEFVDSTVEINSINLTDVDVVKGAELVDVVKFEIETDDVSGVFIDAFQFQGYYNATGTVNNNGSIAGTTAANQNQITKLSLYMRTSAGYELLESNGGFDLQNGVVKFDDFDEVFVPVASSMEFLLTVDVSDNENIVGGQLTFALMSSDIEDDDNTQLCTLSNTAPTNCLGANSTRTVTITGAGRLTVEADNTDTEVDDEKYILAGTNASSTDFVASFELTAENEAIEIEDMVFTISGATNFGQAAQEIVIYDNDKSTILFRETVTNNNTVRFNNINLIVQEGSQNIYVKVVTDPIGDNENGEQTVDTQFTLMVSTVDGVDSGDDAIVRYENDTTGTVTTTNPTTPFAIVPVKFSDVEFVTSAAGVNVSTTTTNGNDKNLAILKLTADSWVNSDRNDGSDLEIYVNQLQFTTSESDPTVVNGYEIRRIGNGSTNYIACTLNTDQVTCPVGTGSVSTREFVSGEVGYYLVRADVTAPINTNTSIKLTLDNLNEGTPMPISYVSSDAPTAPFTYFRVEDDLVESPDVTVNNN